MTATIESTNTIDITSHGRNIGYGWTNQPERVRVAPGREYLGIVRPGQPGVTGSMAACIREYQRARRVNRGNDWRDQLYVNGRAVVAYQDWDGWYEWPGMREYLRRVGDQGYATVRLQADSE